MIFNRRMLGLSRTGGLLMEEAKTLRTSKAAALTGYGRGQNGTELLPGTSRSAGSHL